MQVMQAAASLWAAFYNLWRLMLASHAAAGRSPLRRSEFHTAEAAGQGADRGAAAEHHHPEQRSLRGGRGAVLWTARLARSTGRGELHTVLSGSS